MRKLTCIRCPRGCRLLVDEKNNYAVSGQGCSRGEEYGRSECIAPKRTLTSTVPVKGGVLSRCPVKTSCPIPKGKMEEAMKALRALQPQAPIKTGDVLLPHIAGTQADLVACRNIRET